jgi:hypothetical protein
MLLVGIAMAAALVTCTGLGGGLMVGGFFSGDDLAATAAVEAPAPAPAPAVAPPPVAPEPVPEPAVPVVRSVDITSAPDGAEVWEGGQLLCVTPCKVEHGAGQDLPRQFILKRGGHEDLTVELQTLGVPLRGELVKKKTAPRPPSPAPAVRPTPKPKPQPAPPADDDLRVER